MVYKLSKTLSGHGADVRCVASPLPTVVLSASRDKTALVWQRQDDASGFDASPPYHAGSRYVNAVAFVESSPEAPQGYIAAGGNDTIINVFPIGSDGSEPSHMLLGHSENVCAIESVPSGGLISGSWDKTARVWKNFVSTYELRGHEAAVWAVAALDGENFLTGSADKTIRLWGKHKSIRTFSGHSDAVRGLVKVEDIGFASCSNDSEIRVWTLEGDIIHILSGHTSFVYSLSVLPSGDLVSCGEDRSVRIWKDGECAQILTVPAISIWSVSTMSNGDIVSGSSDGKIRIFSDNENRWASEQDLKAYDEQVSSQALPSQQIGDVKKSDLPGAEALSKPGNKEGQVIMVKNSSGSVEAHQWTSGAWQKIGEVVDAVGSGRKQLHDGKEYDYVFDVDIKDGAPPLKLPYNASENPYQAALRFLQRNELPESYIDEVVRFIEKNAGGTEIGRSDANTYVDPFTGASRYQSAQQNTPVQGQTYQDPFTGAGGYHGGDSSGSNNQTSNTRSQSATPSILPVRETLTFMQSKIPAMKDKIFSVSDALAEAGNPTIALSEAEKLTFNTVLDTLSAPYRGPTSPPESDIRFAEVELILQVIDRWPSEQRFPVLDLLRVVIGAAPDALKGRLGILDRILHASGWVDGSSSSSSASPKHVETNTLLSLRAIANAFQMRGSPPTSYGYELWSENLCRPLANGNFKDWSKNHAVALGTILLNSSSAAISRGEVTPLMSIVPIAEKINDIPSFDIEGKYRGYVAVGNVACHLALSRNRNQNDVNAVLALSKKLAGNTDKRFKVIHDDILRCLS